MTRPGSTRGDLTSTVEFQDPATKRITFADPNNVASMEWMKAFIDEIGVEDIDAIWLPARAAACNDLNDTSGPAKLP